MSRKVSHKAVNTDVTTTNYVDHNIISTSAHTILQTGNRCTAYTINVTRAFLDAIKDKGGSLTFSESEQLLLRLSWEGNTDVSPAFITKWTVNVLAVFKGLKSAVMQEISKDIFDPLRREVIERIYHEHDARMSALLGGSLIFVFTHRNRHDADKMVEKKHEINKIFQQLFGNIGNMEVKFSLSVERDVKSRQWIQSSVEEPSGNSPSDDRSESLILSSRCDSIEMELKQLRDLVSEMKNILHKMSDKFLSGTHVSKVTPVSETEEQLKTQPEKYTLSPPEVPEPEIPEARATLPVIGPFFDEVGSEDGITGSRVFCGKTNLMTEVPEQHDQTEPSRAVSKPRDQRDEIRRKEDIAGKESSREIVEHTRQQNRLDQALAKNYGRAVTILSQLPVCGRDEGQVNRLAISVAMALEKEDPKPSRARAQDTVLCLDVSDSLRKEGFEEMKQAAYKFVDGIETMAEKHGLEENLALVVMGGGARVVRQLTNDYTAIRDAIDNLFIGGRSPFMEALVVCIASIQAHGGTYMKGDHYLKPRIIFLTDGYATDESVVEGPDLMEVDQHGRVHVVQLAKTINSSGMDPVTWVSVGNADKQFLRSLSVLGHGKYVECKNIESLSKHFRLQDTIGSIHNYVRKAKFDERTEAIGQVVQALAGDMDEDDRGFVIQGVKQKLEFPDTEEMSLDFRFVHEVSELPPLGTRVIRGPDWQHENQDCEGPGTIVNHTNDRYMLWVLWDFSSLCGQYRYGPDGKMDVVEVEDQPRFLLPDELIEIGVRVKRGVDWSYGDQDGGKGNTGVVIRKREDGVVKVKWQNGNLESYRYGLDGKMDVAVCEPDDFMKVRSSSQGATASRDRANIADEGYVGYAKTTEERPNIVWQWQDDKGKWQLYSDSDAAKLEKEFTRKPSGSCVLKKKGKGVRVIFKQPMFEKDGLSGSSYAVKRSVVTDAELLELKRE